MSSVLWAVYAFRSESFAGGIDIAISTTSSEVGTRDFGLAGCRIYWTLRWFLVFGSEIDHVGGLCMVFLELQLGIGRVGLMKC